MKVSLDTNILIDEPEVVFDKEKDFVLSFTVIRELDKLKRNPELKRAAQTAIKNIWHQFKEGKIAILNIPDLLGESPDEKIIQDTKDAGASILSNDIAVRIIAQAHGIPISDFEAESEIDFGYTGYTIIEGDIDYEKRFVQIKELQLEEFNETFGTSLRENQYCIVDRIVDKNDIWVNHKGTVTRISQSMKPFRDAGMIISPMDSIQMCAIDAVFNPDIPLVVIDGKLGTGKTILTLMGALASTIGQNQHRKYEQILVTKPPVSINKDLYTGYKPGTTEEKMGGHLGGIKSNLKFLLDKKVDKKIKTMEAALKETVSGTVWEEFFGVVEIDEIQGTSLHDTILIVDEYQLLDEETLFLVLSRIAEGAKVILVGDTAGQTYGMNRANEGFKVLYKEFGKDEEFAFIRLENIYRSKLAKFVARIFDKIKSYY